MSPWSINDLEYEFVAEHIDAKGSLWQGTRRLDNKRWEGFVRTIKQNGDIVEAQFKNGKRNGVAREFKTQDEPYTIWWGMFKNGHKIDRWCSKDVFELKSEYKCEDHGKILML